MSLGVVGRFLVGMKEINGGKQFAGGQREGVSDRRHGALPAFFNRRRLTPAQRRIARYIIDHPYEAPFLSSLELASRVNVSQPSVIRLSSALGYQGYADFQREIRSIVLSQVEAEDGEENKFQSAVTDEISNLHTLRTFLKEEDVISDVGRKLAASEPLVVLGLRVSAPMASYFGYFVMKIHSDVRLLTDGGSTVFDQLSRARQAGGEWVLCFLLPRHPRETLEAMSYAKELGFCIATVTDHAPESAVRASDVVLPAGVGTRFVFDSQAAAMVLAGALVEAISDASPAQAQARLEDFEQRAAELEWFITE
jgi:DNA-binding MurR/RpiR family transcriptional regulator